MDPLTVATATFATAKYVAGPIANSASKLIERCAGPLADEIGIIIRDSVIRRRKNLDSVSRKLLDQLQTEPGVPPVLDMPAEFAHRAFEQSSLSDDDRIQQMWAGLMASVCKQMSHDGSELLWTSILSKMTPTQAVILEWSATRTVRKEGLIETEHLTFSAETAHSILPGLDPLIVAGEIFQLKSNGLIHPAALLESEVLLAGMCAACTPLGLTFYSRVRGQTSNPFHLPAPAAATDSGDVSCGGQDRWL